MVRGLNNTSLLKGNVTRTVNVTVYRSQDSGKWVGEELLSTVTVTTLV